MRCAAVCCEFCVDHRLYHSLIMAANEIRNTCEVSLVSAKEVIASEFRKGRIKSKEEALEIYVKIPVMHTALSISAK